MDGSYRLTQSRDDLGEPVKLIHVRALMIPPGIPDFFTRTRLVEAGEVALSGRAWAGRGAISRVEVSVDGGETWSETQLEDAVSPFAWRGWIHTWLATPGKYVLCVRATDFDGNVQPAAQPWNYQGVANNMVQRVSVVVE